jgi:hypothetical protein
MRHSSAARRGNKGTHPNVKINVSKNDCAAYSKSPMMEGRFDPIQRFMY